MLDTVGARVMALIIGVTLPLASIAALMAWHGYQQNLGIALLRTENDARAALALIAADIDKGRALLGPLSERDVLSGVFARGSVPDGPFGDGLGAEFCRIALIDPQGRQLAEMSGSGGGGKAAACADPALLANPGTGNEPPVTLVSSGQRAFLRFSVPATGDNRVGDNRVMGRLIAIRPLSLSVRDDGAQNDGAQGGDGTAGGDNARLYLILPSGAASALTPGPEGTGPPAAPLAAAALARLEMDGATRAAHDAFSLGDTTYVFAPAVGHAGLVAAAERTAEENRASRVFFLRVALIVLCLAVELLAVALAAHAFLVVPLERLAGAVAAWRKGAPFDPRIDRAMPREIRDLERAFLRATRRLGRDQRALEKSARHQDMLIREIHHRVKNNLQVVVSLLSLQSTRIRSDEARGEFRRVRDRVRALAALHRHLYSEDGLSGLDVRRFLDELCAALSTSYDAAASGRARLELDIEPVPISPDQAAPLALIVTETVTNALRHAFPGERRGVVRVTLRRTGGEKGEVELVLEDDGVGLIPEGSAEEGGDRRGIGLRLIRGFARQIRATLDVGGEGGARYRLVFVPETPSPTALAVARRAIETLRSAEPEGAEEGAELEN